MTENHALPTADRQVFILRRAALAASVGDGVALIPTARECLRNHDNPYPFRADSCFWYLTGFPEPEAALVIVRGRSILFCREKNPEREIWTGFNYGPEAAREIFGFDEAYPFQTLEDKLAEYLPDASAIWHAPGKDAEWDRLVTRAWNAVRKTPRKDAPASLHDWRPALAASRQIKDAAEIAWMKAAADITSEGHRRAMTTCRAGMPEYELEAVLSHAFRGAGATGHAYNPIVAGGAHACVLHYTRNDGKLAAGDLVLIDAGCELAGYAADITRTFPVNGRFTAAARDCYEIVLAAQTAAIAATAPGVAFEAPHQAAVRVLTTGMRDLGLLAGSVDGLIESEAYKRFYMHGTGHWLGLDVHDTGVGEMGKTLLAPGMTLTCEPGLYIAPAPDVPTALAGMGIRIEDDLLITPDGVEVYTKAPKAATEIEALMRG